VKRAVNESTRTILTSEGWKLSLRGRDLNELYYLPRDPSETRNLHGNEKYEGITGELTERIHGWQKQTEDKLRV
jgi:hypothetical protein